MDRLQFKQWFGHPEERHSANDWNRLVYNVQAVADKVGASIPLFFREIVATISPPASTTDAGALTMSMARGMESCIGALSGHLGITYQEFSFHDGDFISFVDVNRWEFGIWACYRAAGGVGRPEDTQTVETLMFPFSGWVVSPDGTFSQTVESIIAEAGMKGIVGLTQHQIGQEGAWALLGPFVAEVGDWSVTVKCVGLNLGGKDLELTLFKLGDDVMQYDVSVGTAGWVNTGDGFVTQTVPVSGLSVAAEGVIGYATGDLAGAMAGVASGLVMTGQSAGQIVLRADRIPTQTINLVITAVV